VLITASGCPLGNEVMHTEQELGGFVRAVQRLVGLKSRNFEPTRRRSYQQIVTPLVTRNRVNRRGHDMPVGVIVLAQLQVVGGVDHNSPTLAVADDTDGHSGVVTQ